MTSRNLATYPLPPQMKEILARHRFFTDADVLALRPSELAKELRMSVAYALEIQKNIKAAGATGLPASKSELRDAMAAPSLAHTLYSASSRHSATTSGTSTSDTNDLTAAEQQQLRDAAAQASVGARHGISQGASALELAAKQLYDPQSAIFTLSQDLDGLMGGNGLEVGALTEVCGVPGAGKTQLAIQIACNATVPKEFGGCAGEAVYIDTEGSFIPARALEIADGLCRHMRNLVASEPPESPVYQAAYNHSARLVLSKIHVYRVFDHVEQASVIEALPAFLQLHPTVRVVILDSVAFHLRRIPSPLQRSKLLSRASERLQELATKFDVAVLLINQVTRRVTAGTAPGNDNPSGSASRTDDTTGAGDGYIMPALGDNWGHALRHRIILKWQGAVRVATVIKSPTLGVIDVPFRVTKDGVRDCLLPHLQDLAALNASDSRTGQSQPSQPLGLAQDSSVEQGISSSSDAPTSTNLTNVSTLQASSTLQKSGALQEDTDDTIPLTAEEQLVAAQCAAGQELLSEPIQADQIDYFHD